MARWRPGRWKIKGDVEVPPKELKWHYHRWWFSAVWVHLEISALLKKFAFEIGWNLNHHTPWRGLDLDLDANHISHMQGLRTEKVVVSISKCRGFRKAGRSTLVTIGQLNPGGLFPCWVDQQHVFLEEIHTSKCKVCVCAQSQVKLCNAQRTVPVKQPSKTTAAMFSNDSHRNCRLFPRDM